MSTRILLSRQMFRPIWNLLIGGGLSVAICVVLAAPQTAAGAKPVPEKATYTITFTGDLVGVEGPDTATGTATKSIQDDAIGHMILEKDSVPHKINLYAFFKTNLGNAADSYFKSGDWTAVGNAIHGIYPIKRDPANGVTVTIFFAGYNSDQSDSLMYRLDMEGSIVLGDGQDDLQTWANPGALHATITPRVAFEKWSVRPDTKGGGQNVLKLEDQPFTDSTTGIDITAERIQ